MRQITTLFQRKGHESMNNLTLRRLAGHVGAEIDGIDLNADMSDAAFAEILDAFHAHAVLVFRGQDLSPDRQVAFSRRFGPAIEHVLEGFRLGGHPEVFVVSNVHEDGKPKGAVYAGQYWHSDLSYMAEPAMASMLHAHQVPSAGGDTMFAAMHAAHDALSPPLGEFLAGLQAVHDYTHAYDTVLSKLPGRAPMTAAEKAKVPPVVHPVIRRHPATERSALYVNPGFTTPIQGLEEDESRALLDFLFAHATRPEFIYRHHWRPGDVVIWDNRCLMHRAVADYDMAEARHMHRTTIAGDAPLPAT